jgi:hypothetical protein
MSVAPHVIEWLTQPRDWRAPRIHGELLKLGFEVAESPVSKYLVKRRGPPSQNWRTFLRNHADAIAAVDLCVVPTISFECLFALLVSRLLMAIAAGKDFQRDRAYGEPRH